MIQQVEKSPKVALCRNCYGTGFVVSGILRNEEGGVPSVRGQRQGDGEREDNL